MRFSYWTGALVKNSESETTDLTMPAAATNVIANFGHPPQVHILTVVHGTGGGSYRPGVVVAIGASVPAATTKDICSLLGVTRLSYTLPPHQTEATAITIKVKNVKFPLFDLLVQLLRNPPNDRFAGIKGELNVQKGIRGWKLAAPYQFGYGDCQIGSEDYEEPQFVCTYKAQLQSDCLSNALFGQVDAAIQSVNVLKEGKFHADDRRTSRSAVTYAEEKDHIVVTVTPSQLTISFYR
jgi:hypothetical protein